MHAKAVGSIIGTYEDVVLKVSSNVNFRVFEQDQVIFNIVSVLGRPSSEAYDFVVVLPIN